MRPNQSPTATAVALNQMKGIIHGAVNRYMANHNRQPWEREALEADAHFHFLCGWRECKTEFRFKSEARQYFWRVVYMGLIDDFRIYKRARTATTILDVTNEELDAKPSKSSFNVREFIEDLGADAQAIVRCILDLPHDVAAVLGPNGSPTKTRVAIRKHLQGSGWTLPRIKKSFDEIRGALNAC